MNNSNNNHFRSELELYLTRDKNRKQLSSDIHHHTSLLKPLTDIIVQYSLLSCPRVLHQAVECGGIAFGGFVRDWIVAGRSFKDLDLWFKTEDDANKFIASLFPLYTYDDGNENDCKSKMINNDGDIKDSKDVNDKCNKKRHIKYIVFDYRELKYHGLKNTTDPFPFVNEDQNNYYPFARMRLLLICHINNNNNNFIIADKVIGDKYELVVDIIVSPIISTNDLDINCLTFNGLNLGLSSGSLLDLNLDLTQSEEYIDILINNIRIGMAIMLPSYQKIISTRPNIASLRIGNFIRRQLFHIVNYSSYNPNHNVLLCPDQRSTALLCPDQTALLCPDQRSTALLCPDQKSTALLCKEQRSNQESIINDRDTKDEKKDIKTNPNTSDNDISYHANKFFSYLGREFNSRDIEKNILIRSGMNEYIASKWYKYAMDKNLIDGVK